MGTHIMGFIFYTLAMLGVLFIAFVVYKKVVLTNACAPKTKFKVEDMLKLSPRKTLYVINYQNQRFLIASDIDSTTLLAKLDENTSIEKVLVEQKQEQEPPVDLEAKLH